MEVCVVNAKLRNINHDCDFCVVGGGLSGMCAAIAAARRGLSVVIMQDRPMFGGNASSEVRMWISGALGDNNRETGILEEISLENMYRNPYRTYPIWDSILFEIVKNEKNITVLLNCSCLDCEMDANTIKKVIGWQLTTQTYHTVTARYFADCSGDSILAPLTGAEYTSGRESRSLYNESIAPEIGDKKTMGNTCLIQARETNSKRTFVPPQWAYKFTEDELKKRFIGLENPKENYWYLELGGTYDTIHDAEEIRDELLAIAYGMWDYIKNSGNCNADNWELDWVGFLPGKRENRRYIGDIVVTQNDIASGGKFEDVVAFGGWTMDDHNPDGIRTSKPATIHHPTPSPFGIPYRSLYSKNIKNLFFAGRNISVTHSAMSATRIMGTCATIGQAMGTAAWVAAKYNLTPRDVYKNKLSYLQQELIYDDCYLPGIKMQMSQIIKSAKVITDGQYSENLLNGYDRKIGESENCWQGRIGNDIRVCFENAEYITELRFVFDSDLNRKTNGDLSTIADKDTVANYSLNQMPVHIPETLVKNFRIELINECGEVISSEEINNNRQRLVKLSVNKECSGFIITPLSTYGSEIVRIFSINAK